MSEASLSWAISAHDRQRRDSPRGVKRSPAPAPAAPPRRASARSSHCRTARRRRGRPRPAARARSTSASARRERTVARRDLVRVDQALAVEAEPPPLLGLREKAFRIVQAVEHPIEHRDARRARREHDQLQRGRDRLPRQRRAAVEGRREGRSFRRSGRRPRLAISARREHPGGGLDHRQHRLADCVRTPLTRCAEIARGTTTKSAFDRATASRSSECHSVPTPLTRIATGIGHVPRNGLDRGLARLVLVVAASRHPRGRARRDPHPLRAPWRSRAGWTPAGTAPTARRTGRAHVDFASTRAHRRRIMARP